MSHVSTHEEESMALRSVLPKPKVHINKSARQELTPELRPLLNSLLEMIEAYAYEHDVTVVETEVGALTYVDDGMTEIVVIQIVDLNAEAASNYWDGLTEAADNWRQSLMPTQQTFAQPLVVDVMRNTHGKAV
jgi:hypothetical protein